MWTLGPLEIMKVKVILAFVATLMNSTWAFTVRPSFTMSPLRSSGRGGNGESLKMGLDPHVWSSLIVSADETLGAVQGAVDGAGLSVPPAVMDASQSTVAPAADAAATSAQNGWFGFLTGPIEGLIAIIHSSLVAVGVSENAWGVSIVGMTVLIKLLTFPLTKQQLESTQKMQVLQPRVKEVQTTYQSNPDVMNQKIAELYQQEQVNPLAGCIPALVQLPVFIGLYRAILTLSKEDRLGEPFLWLPNLEGPVYGADPAHGSDWIFKGWVDGVPSLGWDDTIAFLSLPVLLVVSQFISQALITPKNQEQQTNFVIKLLPLLIGWFSLNVPAALGIYWVANNVITTLITLQIRSGLDIGAASVGSSATSVGVEMEPPTTFRPAPMREKPSGFATPASAVLDDEVKPITPIDAEIVPADDEEDDVVEETAQIAPKKRGKKKKRRKN